MASQTVRYGVLLFKSLAVIVGATALVVSLDYIINEYSYLGSAKNVGFVDIVLVVGLLGLILSSVALLAALPSSLRVRFEHGVRTASSHPTYGLDRCLPWV